MSQSAILSRTSSMRFAGAESQGAAMWLTRAVCGSLFVALCSHLAFPVPFSPVPFTMQPFAVLLVGMLFGPGTGFATLALYLVEGSAGLPVFTPYGLPGLARLLGPTGGFLVAYPVAAALAGLARLHRSGRFVSYLAAGALAVAAIYLCGAAWFGRVMHLPFASALSSLTLPFLLPDAIKVCAAASIAAAFRRQAQDDSLPGTV